MPCFSESIVKLSFFDFPIENMMQGEIMYQGVRYSPNHLSLNVSISWPEESKILLLENFRWPSPESDLNFRVTTGKLPVRGGIPLPREVPTTSTPS